MSTRKLCLYLLFAFTTNAQEIAPKIEAPTPRVTRLARFSKTWLAETSTIAALYATDGALTANGIHRNRCVPTNGVILCNDQPEAHSWLYGRYPTPASDGATIGIVFAATATTLYFTERNHHKWVRWTGRTFAGFTVGSEAVAIRAWAKRL
jgi:hypothetical protein